MAKAKAKGGMESLLGRSAIQTLDQPRQHAHDLKQPVGQFDESCSGLVHLEPLMREQLLARLLPV